MPVTGNIDQILIHVPVEEDEVMAEDPQGIVNDSEKNNNNNDYRRSYTIAFSQGSFLTKTF